MKMISYTVSQENWTTAEKFRFALNNGHLDGAVASIRQEFDGEEEEFEGEEASSLEGVGKYICSGDGGLHLYESDSHYTVAWDDDSAGGPAVPFGFRIPK